jgi:hypothetical protein
VQNDVWEQYELYPDTDLYKLCLLLNFLGELTVENFLRAVQVSVDRHDSLRVVFSTKNSPLTLKASSCLLILLRIPDLPR